MRYGWLALAMVALLLSSCSLLPGTKKAGAAGGAAAGGKGGAGGGGGMSGPPPVSVIVLPVELRDYAPAINLTGEIRAAQRAVLAAEVGGKVTAIAARVGETHRKAAGPLVRINPADYEAQLAAARSQRAQAQAALDEARHGARPQDIAEQQGRVDQAQATLAQAQDNLRRQQKLYDSGVAPEADLVAAKTQVDNAQGALNSQLEALDRLKTGTRAEEIEAAQAKVKAADSSVQLAQLNLAKANVTVPFDAKVTNLMVELGQSVGPGTPLVEVVSDAPGEAWFNLPEADAARIHRGDSVEVRSDALPKQVFTGRVIGVSGAADQTTRQFPVRVALHDKQLLPGMAVRGRILAGQPKPTLMASQDAAYESKLGLIVYRMTPPPPDAQPGANGMPPLPGAEAVPVEVGERIDQMVVITKGDLKPGDLLVTRGKEGIYPGAKIIPTNLMGKGGGKGGGPAGAAPGASAPQTGAGKEPPAPGSPAPTAPAGRAGDGKPQPPTPPTAKGPATDSASPVHAQPRGAIR